jgi:hypothetical protein
MGAHHPEGLNLMGSTLLREDTGAGPAELAHKWLVSVPK